MVHTIRNKELVKPRELRIAQLKDTPPLVIDVRGEKEYGIGHIEDAIHIPLDDLAVQLTTLDLSQEVVTYCMMLNLGASHGERAAALLRAHGFRARALDGGLGSWILADMPIASGGIGDWGLGIWDLGLVTG